ncbi:MAG: sulfatase-like hydrolase/transferase, partial [Planctomycetaceae bacterium]|nr:sulfatase-like hydrolase/transferase [Planctomycetaceae bacterium]
VFLYSDNGGPTPETSSRNEPLRGFKGQMFEGGIRVPFVMQWKGRIPAGQTYREPVMGFDCHATALAAAGVTPPEETPLDGVDLIPFVMGQASGRPHEQLFWRAGQKHAARVGDWKLVQERGRGAQLFDLRNDVGETTDLAGKEPERLKQLQTAFAEWEQGTQSPKWVRQDASNAEPGGKPKADATPRRRRPAAGRIDDAFKAADKDSDGKLTRDESPQPGVFDAVDDDMDGFATLEEVRAYYRNRNNPR